MSKEDQRHLTKHIVFDKRNNKKGKFIKTGVVYAHNPKDPMFDVPILELVKELPEFYQS